MPVILIGVAVSIFFVFTNPLFSEIALLNRDAASYKEALDNAQALDNEKDKLTTKFNSINPENLMKIEKFIPENVNNIRLILEIEKIALPYGMALKDVKYTTVDKNATGTAPDTGTVIQGGVSNLAPKDYGIFDLEFSTSGSYDNFINFTKDLQSNLRIVDISSIVFSSDNLNLTNAKTNPTEIYKYNFKIKTYWLKN